MTPANTSAQRRYPGLKPFERNQSLVFHGRRDDVQRFTNLILREHLVVLFAKSGIGKTSLLQAGVAPELEKQDYLPIFLRTEKTGVPLLESVRSLIEKHEQNTGFDNTGLVPEWRPTLWELMKRYEFDINGLPATPVLVFDQFEETFTLAHGEESRNAFLGELADLANETMPEALRSALLAKFNEGLIDVETMHWWEKQPEIRIVLSIRSDFLHMIDGISTRIPGILKNRYQLHPLNREKARVAIVQPALAEGQFISPPFTYNEDALTEIIDFLAGREVAGRIQASEDAQAPKRKDEIESVNLQIICQDIEERIIDYQKPPHFEVVPEFYNFYDGLQSSIRNFYKNQLDAFPKAYADRIQNKKTEGGKIADLDGLLIQRNPDLLRAVAQRMIEEDLVTSGNRRNSVVDDTLLDKYNITADFLDTLVDKSRLLRKEPRLDDFFYEISHDTLLPAIVESRDDRREQEKIDLEKEAYKERLAQETQKLQEANNMLVTVRKQRKLARTVALTSFISLLLFTGFLIWVTYDYVNAAQDQLELAEINTSRELYEAAIPGYLDLLGHRNRLLVLRYSKGKIVKDELERVKVLEQMYWKMEGELLAGDSLLFLDNYALALVSYHKAYKNWAVYDSLNQVHSPVDDTRPFRVDIHRMKSKQLQISQRIENASETLIREFKISQRDFEVFKEARLWGQARRFLRKMQALLPEHPDDIKKLQTALNLSEAPKNYVERELEACEKLLQ